MADKEYEMTEQDYLAEQHEYEESMNHYDEDGYCEFCGSHEDDGIHYKCWT